MIDRDYTGEVKVLMTNSGVKDFNVKKGDRVAQMIVERIAVPEREVQSIEETSRGGAGFGSTGLNTALPTAAPAAVSPLQKGGEQRR